MKKVLLAMSALLMMSSLASAGLVNSGTIGTYVNGKRTTTSAAV